MEKLPKGYYVLGMHHLNDNKLKQLRGFNLVEAAIVLGVVGLIIGGIWIAAVTVMENNSATNLARAVISICAQGEKHFPSWAAQDTADPADRVMMNAVAYRAGIVPKDWSLQAASPYVNSCCSGGAQTLRTAEGIESMIAQFGRQFETARGLGGGISIAFWNVPRGTAAKFVRSAVSAGGGLVGSGKSIAQFRVEGCAGYGDSGFTAPCVDSNLVEAANVNWSAIVFGSSNKIEFLCRL